MDGAPDVLVLLVLLDFVLDTLYVEQVKVRTGFLDLFALRRSTLESGDAQQQAIVIYVELLEKCDVCL